jgi:hypothetical protein
MAAGYEIRVSDAEREAAASELREHFASGRLDQEELDERLSRALTAKTRGDLNALFTDLPANGHSWANAGAPSGPGRPGWPGDGWTFPPRDSWRQSTSSGGSQGQWQGPAWGAEPGRVFARAAFGMFLLVVLFTVGILGAFGIGAGRPFGIVLILAAFALLRRLLMMIFGRRRGGGCGPRRRC